MGDLGKARDVVISGAKPRAAFYLITVGDKVVYAVLDIEVMAEKIADSASPPNEDKAVMPIGDIAAFLTKRYKPRTPDLDLIHDKIT